jgi:hypothetical protein
LALLHSSHRTLSKISSATELFSWSKALTDFAKCDARLVPFTVRVNDHISATLFAARKRRRCGEKFLHDLARSCSDVIPVFSYRCHWSKTVIRLSLGRDNGILGALERSSTLLLRFDRPHHFKCLLRVLGI